MILSGKQFMMLITLFSSTFTCLVSKTNVRLLGRSSRGRITHGSRLLMSTAENASVKNQFNGDVLISGLNGAQDIAIRVVSCRELIQEMILKNDLAVQPAQALGELMVCNLLMASNMKGEETLQLNLVGTEGCRSLVTLSGSDLKARGMVGNSQFSIGDGVSELRMRDLLGEGQVQVIRSHPFWKSPNTGMVTLRDTSVALNMAMYMTESEQRSSAILTDVKVEGGLCRYALGVMVERLPGATEENIEASIKNLGMVEKKGLRSYLDRTEEERKAEDKMFRGFETPLNNILDDCLQGMEEAGIRWSKDPSFRCSCSIDRVWRALSTLPKDEIESIVKDGEDVKMKCEFCSTSYSVPVSEVAEQLLA